jgi:hypothetical protein
VRRRRVGAVGGGDIDVWGDWRVDPVYGSPRSVAGVVWCMVGSVHGMDCNFFGDPFGSLILQLEIWNIIVLLFFSSFLFFSWNLNCASVMNNELLI